MKTFISQSCSMNRRKRHHHIGWIILCLLNIRTTSSECPKSCSVCIPAVIICENGGFTEFPKSFSKELENITLVGHHFSSTYLNPTNLTGLSYPLRVSYLAIRASSVQDIYARTFSSLTYLKILDLSENQDINVHDNAFENLKIDTLKLNNIGKLKLYPNAFEKLRVKNLLMISSRLTILDRLVFLKIDKVVSHFLSLANNNFRTIDREFEKAFKGLKKINLTGNPFVCNCSLVWLKRLSMLNAYEKIDISFPKCVSPGMFRDKTLTDIPFVEFKCFPPKIREIGVHFVNQQTAKLSCRIDSDISRQSQTELKWSSNTDKTSKIELIDENSITMRIEKPSHTNQNEYKCIAENKVGSTSIIVNFIWPSVNVRRTNLTFPLDQFNPVDSTSWTSSFYFRKRYTLIELIVAVVSTLIATILIFLISYRVCIHNSDCPNFSKKFYYSQKFPLQSKGYVDRYPQIQSFTTPDTVIHGGDSNSPTYDCISVNNALFSQQINNSTLLAHSAQFIDYKTHERVYAPHLLDK